MERFQKINEVVQNSKEKVMLAKEKVHEKSKKSIQKSKEAYENLKIKVIDARWSQVQMITLPIMKFTPYMDLSTYKVSWENAKEWSSDKLSKLPNPKTDQIRDLIAQSANTYLKKKFQTYFYTHVKNFIINQATPYLHPILVSPLSIFITPEVILSGGFILISTFRLYQWIQQRDEEERQKRQKRQLAFNEKMIKQLGMF